MRQTLALPLPVVSQSPDPAAGAQRRSMSRGASAEPFRVPEPAPERPRALERPERRERPERAERPERPDQAQRSERPKRPERPERPERAEGRRERTAERAGERGSVNEARRNEDTRKDAAEPTGDTGTIQADGAGDIVDARSKEQDAAANAADASTQLSPDAVALPVAEPLLEADATTATEITLALPDADDAIPVEDAAVTDEPGQRAAPDATAAPVKPDAQGQAIAANTEVAARTIVTDGDPQAAEDPLAAIQIRTAASAGLRAQDAGAASGPAGETPAGSADGEARAPQAQATETKQDPQALRAAPSAGDSAEAAPKPAATSTPAPLDPAGVTTPQEAGRRGIEGVQQTQATPATPQAAPEPRVVVQAGLAAVPIELGLKAGQGMSRFDIRLDPAELGRVEVRLEFRKDGEVTARLVVDRVETLALLQRDARTLERAFEQVGLRASDGGISFQLRDQGAEQRNARDGEAGQDGASGQRMRAELIETVPEAARTVRAWRGGTGIDRLI